MRCSASQSFDNPNFGQADPCGFRSLRKSIGLVIFFFFQKKKQKALFRFAEEDSVKLTNTLSGFCLDMPLMGVRLVGIEVEFIWSLVFS
jgi:hypothetical protein